jgi:dihydroneopterin aldolase
MPDRILLSGIEFFGYHGVYPEERRLGQRFRVDVELSADLTGAETWSDLSRTVDYTRVLAAVVELGTGEPVPLLETLAARIAAVLLDRFPIRQVTVRVTKPAPPIPGITGGVTVEVTRP